MRAPEALALHPHVHATYPLEDAARALRDLAERRAMGKTVLLL